MLISRTRCLLALASVLPWTLRAQSAQYHLTVPSDTSSVIRVEAHLRVPDGPGVFILNPHQEVWAYTPGTRRFRQVTSEDGHVVAVARAPDGRRRTPTCAWTMASC